MNTPLIANSPRKTNINSLTGIVAITGRARPCVLQPSRGLTTLLARPSTRKQGTKLRRLMTFAWPCLLPKQCVVCRRLCGRYVCAFVCAFMSLVFYECHQVSLFHLSIGPFHQVPRSPTASAHHRQVCHSQADRPAGRAPSEKFACVALFSDACVVLSQACLFCLFVCCPVR